MLRSLSVMAAMVAVALIASALVPGSYAPSTDSFGVARTVAPASNPRNSLSSHVTTVTGSSLSAKRYGALDGARENQGIDARGQLTSDLTPLPARAFRRPIAAYRRYAEIWAVHLSGAVATLKASLMAADSDGARRDWGVAFADYLRLGAVYGLLPGTLDDRLAEVPPNLGYRHFPGLHMLERGLWTGASPRSLVPAATALARAVADLQRTLPVVAITPLVYATRAHEILEDAQRDLMSGADVPWSDAGVLGTAAGLFATREVIKTLVPLLQGRDNTLAESQNWLDILQSALTSLQRPDGSWPTVGQLTQMQRERLNGALAGTLSALSDIPGTLETKGIPVIPAIPRKAK